MDPVSIAASVVTLSQAVYSVVTTLYTFADATAKVDDTVKSFCEEIRCLFNTLDAISSTLRSPSVQNVILSDTSRELRVSLNHSLENCRRTVDRLEYALKNIKNKKGKVFQRAVRQIKLNMKGDEIKTFRSQIHTHCMSLGMSLQLIQLEVINRMPIAANTDIISGMERLTELVQQVNANHQFTQNEQQLPGSDKEELSRSTEQLNQLAAKVLCQSSIIAESVVSESSCRRRALSLVGGEWMNAFGRMQVEAWIPPADQDYATIRSFAISSSHHGTSIYSVPAESTYFETAEHGETSVADSISNDDQDIHMIRRCLASGYEAFGQGDYQQATGKFEPALEYAKEVELEQISDLDLTHARLKLGISYLHEEKMNESEQILQGIAREQFGNNVASAHALDAAYTLARIYLYKDNLDTAERYCQKARAGRELTLGEKAPSYFLTLRLLSRIYQARGLLSDSLACLDVIPDPNILPEDTPEIYSPEICPYRNKALGLLKAKYPNWGSTDFDFDAALWWAAEEGHEAVAGYFLTREVPVKAMYKGRTALHQAASKGYDKMVWIILAKRADLSKSRDQDGWTALHWAASRGHESTVQLLLANGADITSTTTDVEGRNALHIAASKGHEAIVRLLLANGTDMMAADRGGYTALHLAAGEGYETTVRLLLAEGADITAVTLRKSTALINAARNGYEVTVQLLLTSGADIKAADKYGYTAIIWAATEGHQAVVRLLLASEADITAASTDKDTALHVATYKRYEAVVRFLLANGADITAAGRYEDSALHIAARYGDEAILKLLLASGADITAVNKYGETALYDAAREGHEVVVKLLLDSGADVRMKNLGGKTPKDCATHWTHEAMTKLLDDAEEK
ncbi:MAG: hypothetical protein Q9187_008191, partial [Circinaria calcarea]